MDLSKDDRRGSDILQGNNNTVGMAKHEERKTMFLSELNIHFNI
jgi:hypothetical protein